MTTQCSSCGGFCGKVCKREDSDYADIHSCHYGCPIPACISRQRDELRDYAMAIYKAVQDADPKHRMTFKQVMEFAVTKLKEKT